MIPRGNIEDPNKKQTEAQEEENKKIEASECIIQPQEAQDIKNEENKDPGVRNLHRVI